MRCPDYRADMEALDAGALVVADTEGQTLVEFLVPVTMEAYESIRACWNESTWLLSMLCLSVISRAESPGDVAVPVDPLAPHKPTPELEQAVIDYTGVDPELWIRNGLRTAATEEVYAKAERLAGPNRAQRRSKRKNRGR
jgi:hypothetical protein